MSFGSSKSQSTPVDMTPQPFKNLQGPFADVLAKMLGMQTTPGATGTAPRPANALGYGPDGRPITGYRSEIFERSGNDEQGRRRVPVYGTAAPMGPAANTYTPTPGSFLATGNPNDLLKGLPQYEGPLTGTIGANEQSMLDFLQQKTLAGPQGPDDPLLKAYIESVQRPILEGLTETLTRDLPGRFTQAGQMVQPRGSSAFDRAAAIATRGAAQAQQDIGTQIGYEAYKNSGDRYAQEIDTTIKNLQAQALPRLIQELGIERGIEQFNQRVTALMQTLGITAGVTQPTIANNQSSKSTQIGLK